MSRTLVFLADASKVIGDGAKAACGDNCNKVAIDKLFPAIVNSLLFLAGAVSVIMIIIGGLRYILSNGDPKRAEAGRNTLMYAVIGLGITIVAYAIVAFVIAAIGKAKP